MRNRFILKMLVLAAFLALATPAVAAETPIPANNPNSTELVNRQNVTGDITKGLFWNGKTVTFHGEAIGEVMVRDAYAWIHLNDDAYMERNVEEGAKLAGYNSGMAVWVSADLTKQIDTYGDYKHEGTIVEVDGVFNAACMEHGGDMDIHATTLRVLRAGHVVDDPIQPWKVVLALVLIAVAIGLWQLDKVTRNRISPHRGI